MQKVNFFERGKTDADVVMQTNPLIGLLKGEEV
jgi:hypothetical protein